MKTLHLVIIAVLIVAGICNTEFAFGTSQTCDKTILPHNWSSSHIYVTDASGNLPYMPLTYHAAIFHDDDEWNTSDQPRTVQVTLTIQDKYTGQQVFNQTQSLQMQPCSGPESVKWRFVPVQASDYIATVSDDRGNVSTGFKSIPDSPLQQFKSGIKAEDVKCVDNYTLVIKAEDGFPACVKPDTAQILTERGWATNVANHGPPMTPFGARTFQIKNRTATFDLQINPNLRGYVGRYTTDMIAVVRGEIIAWENSDNIPHTITSTNGVFDSGTISTGSEFILDTKPLVAGYYDYYDRLNNTLTGSIRIVDPHLYNDSILINMTKKLNTTKLFLEKYPDASVKVEHKYYDSVNFETEKTNNTNSEAFRTLQLEITFDKNDTGVMKISLNCLGHISTSIGNVTENIESGWCITHLG